MKSVTLLLATIALGCTDTRDWTDVQEVAKRAKCGMPQAAIRDLCVQFGAENYGEPTVKIDTPQYYCAAGDTFISFWLRDGKLHSFQVGDSIGDENHESSKVDGVVHLCSAGIGRAGETTPVEKRPN